MKIYSTLYKSGIEFVRLFVNNKEKEENEALIRER
jgi:hypothetical protein